MTWRGHTVTQIFGVANNNYRLGYHPGTDFRFSLGDPQPAFAAGVARFYKDRMDGYGNFGTITLDNGDVIFYAHLEKALVSSGSRVVNGQPVFVTGATGWVEGVHAHIEYRVGGDKNTPVDITKKLKEEDVIGKEDVAQVRIINSEVAGYPFTETHSGKFDAVEMGAWAGQEWAKFINEKWAQGEKFRSNRAKLLKIKDAEITKLNKEITALKANGNVNEDITYIRSKVDLIWDKITSIFK